MGAATINVVLNYFFINKFGYISAAYTTLVTYILYFSFHYLLAKKIHGSIIYNTKEILTISAGVLVIGIGVIFLEKYWIIRWALIVLVGCYGIFWSEKQFGIIRKAKNKFLRN